MESVFTAPCAKFAVPKFGSGAHKAFGVLRCGAHSFREQSQSHISRSTLSRSGCTGRAFILNTFRKASSCCFEISKGVFSTCQLTPSEQGGVVSDPG